MFRVTRPTGAFLSPKCRPHTFYFVVKLNISDFPILFHIKTALICPCDVINAQFYGFISQEMMVPRVKTACNEDNPQFPVPSTKLQEYDFFGLWSQSSTVPS